MSARGRLPLAAALAATLCYLPNSLQARNPVPADSDSLLIGAENFELYCAECHGWVSSQSFYDADEDESLAELLAELEEARTAAERPVEQDWPEWAPPRGSVVIEGFPQQQRPAEPELEPAQDDELRTAVLDDLYAAIDEYYTGAGEGAAAVPDEDPEQQGVTRLPADNGRIPGATDLSDPAAFFYGTNEVELYDSIAWGVAPTMPGFLDVLGSEEAVWNLVNYIRSLWDEEWRD